MDGDNDLSSGGKWPRILTRVWVALAVLLVLNWMYPVLYRKSIAIDPRKIVEKDPSIWSKKLNGINANLVGVPSFGVYLQVGKERVESRVTNYAALSREGERHSAFFMKAGGPFLYWTMGPDKAAAPNDPISVHVPVNSRYWVLGCGLAGMILAGYHLVRGRQDGAKGWEGLWAADDGKDAI